MIWLVVVVLVLLCLITTVIYNHHVMKSRWEEATGIDVRLIHEAAQHSVRASNLENPILALLEIQAAHRTLDVLIRRYGIPRSTELTGVDTGVMLQTLVEQRLKILDHIWELYPDELPRSDLLHYAQFLKDRDASRHEGALHFENEEAEDESEDDDHPDETRTPSDPLSK